MKVDLKEFANSSTLSNFIYRVAHVYKQTSIFFSCRLYSSSTHHRSLFISLRRRDRLPLVLIRFNRSKT